MMRNIVSQGNEVAAKNIQVPRCALRCKQSSALFLLRVVAKIISVFVMKLENSLAILIHALRRIRLMLNFNLQRKPFMKCQQTPTLRNHVTDLE